MQQSQHIGSRILLIGHEPRYRAELAEMLREEGYAVSVANGLSEARFFLQNSELRAVITDWLGSASVSFAEKTGSKLPVLFVTKHPHLMDIVNALRAGAAEYIRQPCFFPELVARLEKSLVHAPARFISVDGMTLNVEAGELHLPDRVAFLGNREAILLATLMHAAGRCVPRSDLKRCIGSFHARDEIIESYIRKLRKKDTLLYRRINTLYGKGYMFSINK